jgi:hypothetical protein
VILSQWATANRERQGALTESRTTIAGDPFYREWLCGAGQGCTGRILERLYIDNCLPLTVELFRQLAFFILTGFDIAVTAPGQLVYAKAFSPFIGLL